MKSQHPAFDWSTAATWSHESFARLSQPADDTWGSLEPGPRVLVVANDAGGAEVLAAWVKRRLRRARLGQAPALRPTFLLEGPALRVFARAGLVADPTGLPFPQISRPLAFGHAGKWDWILTGTGWASDLEKWALQQARNLQLRSCSYLEHWTNYRLRFRSTDNQFILPDEIWVGDPWAETLAHQAFHGQTFIRLVPNPYFAAIREDFEKSVETDSVNEDIHGQPRAFNSSQRLLYVTEPVGAASAIHQTGAHGNGYTEFDALERFCLWLQTQSEFFVEALRLRPHPAEAPDKYSMVLAGMPGKWHLSPPGHSLLQDCLWSDTVVGCNTMALIVAWLAKRHVLCSIPEQGPACDLPLPAIKRLFPQQIISI